jgi:MFS family permease
MAAILSYGVAEGVWVVLTRTLRQEYVPDHLLSRITSAYATVSYRTMPLGGLIGGFLGHALGLHAPFLVAAVGLGAVGLVVAATAVADQVPFPSGSRRSPWSWR